MKNIKMLFVSLMIAYALMGVVASLLLAFSSSPRQKERSISTPMATTIIMEIKIGTTTSPEAIPAKSTVKKTGPALKQPTATTLTTTKMFYVKQSTSSVATATTTSVAKAPVPTVVAGASPSETFVVDTSTLEAVGLPLNYYQDIIARCGQSCADHYVQQMLNIRAVENAVKK